MERKLRQRQRAVAQVGVDGANDALADGELVGSEVEHAGGDVEDSRAQRLRGAQGGVAADIELAARRSAAVEWHRVSALAREHHLRRLDARSEEHTSELQSLRHLVCRLLLEKKKEQ